MTVPLPHVNTIFSLQKRGISLSQRLLGHSMIFPKILFKKTESLIYSQSAADIDIRFYPKHDLFNIPNLSMLFELTVNSLKNYIFEKINTLRMRLLPTFFIVSSIIVIFSADPITSLIADKTYKPSCRDLIVSEGRNKKGRRNNNHNDIVRKKILLVDDEPDLTFSFKEGLEDAGFNVDVFNESMHALENFKPEFYDLVMLDIVMPEMDGFSLYNELKKIDPRINVCFLTASEQYREDQREAKHLVLGQELFIQKPISLEDLTKEIHARIDPIE
jgi:CheY-like chemotaxis protein